MGTSPFVGQINIFGFSFAPRNYALAQGQTLSISQNAALFSLYGTQYGGNGTQTFALPDLRGRIPLGQGQGPGLSNYSIGQNGGTENIALTTSQLPPHAHIFASTTGTLDATTTKGTTAGPQAGGMLGRGVDTNGTDIPLLYVPAGSTGTTAALAGVNVSGTTGIVGNGLPVPVLQPYLALNFSVALQGVFPSRN